MPLKNSLLSCVLVLQRLPGNSHWTKSLPSWERTYKKYMNDSDVSWQVCFPAEFLVIQCSWWTRPMQICGSCDGHVNVPGHLHVISMLQGRPRTSGNSFLLQVSLGRWQASKMLSGRIKCLAAAQFKRIKTRQWNTLAQQSNTLEKAENKQKQWKILSIVTQYTKESNAWNSRTASKKLLYNKYFTYYFCTVI